MFNLILTKQLVFNRNKFLNFGATNKNRYEKNNYVNGLYGDGILYASTNYD